MKLKQWLEMQSPLFWGIAGSGLALTIGVVDYWTAPEAMLFYLFPVLLAARYGGLRSGLTVSLVSALTWLGVDVLRGTIYGHPLLPYWNVAGRLTVFALFAITVTRMLAAQRQKEELTQFLVHDLRSPLTSVLSGLQTLHALLSERNDELEMELVEAGLIGGNHLLALINSLMDTGRLTGGRMPLNLSAIPPERLLEAACQQVGLWANQTSISIETECQPGGREVIADAALTERVLVNLLGNAIKFSPACSVIMVRVSPFQEDQLEFSISDEGPGMTEREARAVFGKYAQADVKARALGGTGIGLTFCRLAVEAQQGHIWLTSEPGEGTTVTFMLPAIRIPSEEAAVSPAAVGLMAMR